MSETVTVVPQANPNVLTVTDGLSVSRPHLSRLMDETWRLHRHAYPFLKPAMAKYMKPAVITYRDAFDGEILEVERNPNRQHLDEALELAPLAGALAMKLGSGEPMPALTSDQVDQIKTRATPLLPPGIGGFLGKLSVSDINAMVPFALNLDYVQAEVRPYIDKLDQAEPYIDVLTGAGDQTEIGHQLHQETQGLLNLMWGTARQAAFRRLGQDYGKLRRMQTEPDRYVTREDLAVGIKTAAEAVLGGSGAVAPMMHGLVQRALTKTGKAGKVEHVQLNVELLDFGADLIMSSLISVLPKDQRQGYQQLLDIARSSSAASRKFSTLLWASKLVTVGMRQSILEGKGVSPALAKLLAEKGHDLYKGLHRHLPSAMVALGGLFVASRKSSVKTLYEHTLRAIPAPRHGSAVPN